MCFGVYSFILVHHDFLLQKALDPVCCSVCYPCSGIFERYFFCKCFVATVALISMDKEVPYVCSTSLYWNIFEFDLSIFINIYIASAIRHRIDCVDLTLSRNSTLLSLSGLIPICVPLNS